MSILDESTSASSDVPIRAQPTAPHKGGSTPALEAARLRAMRSLSELFQQRCEALGGRKHYAHFEAWLWAARNESAARIVPPIPQRASAAARLELSRKLTSAGLTPADARAACDALDTRCAQLAEQLRHAETTDRAPPKQVAPVRMLPVREDDGGCASVLPSKAARKKAGKRKRDGSAGAGGEGGEDGDAPAAELGMQRVRLVHGETEVVVTEAHLTKLRTLYAITERTGGTAAKPAAKGGVVPSQNGVARHDDKAFLESAFCVLARLNTLQGGHEAAGGMQGACPPAVFDALRADFGVSRECFASPVNCRFPAFCSAAVDVDAPFGSLGSFFALRPLSGAFLANPPFDPPLVEAMAAHMAELLTIANEKQSVLAFVVVIPMWPDQPGWQALRESAHTHKHLRLPSSKHAYIDGGQHVGRREKPIRLSNHDSSIFFLMSAKAAALAPVDHGKEGRLRVAFTGGLKINGALHK